MEGDALAILDCYMASSAALKCRNGEHRTYQLLAASSADAPTCGPGHNSFTTALCDSLKELLDEYNGAYFLLAQLCERINTKRKSQACLQWGRLRSSKRTVQLGRLDRTQERDAAFQKEEPEQSSLLLRLSLRTDDLEDNQIVKLTKQLPYVCHEAEVPLRRISWVGMKATSRETARLLEAEPNNLFQPIENGILVTPFGGLFKAVRTVNTIRRFRNAVRRKQGTRLRAGETEGGTALYDGKTMLIMLAIVAVLLLVPSFS